MKLTVSTTGILPDLVYTPDDLESQEKWALLIFLHGSGERGTDPNINRKVSLPKYLDAGLEIPYIVYIPQCPENITWDELQDEVLQGVDKLLAKYPIDDKRVYLTGFSMGGRGTWNLAVKAPERFAAFMPVAGRMPSDNFLEKVCSIKDKPIWVLHGTEDTAVPVSNSDEIVAALRDCGASQLTYTCYEGGSHGTASDETYSSEDIMRWFLKFALS